MLIRSNTVYDALGELYIVHVGKTPRECQNQRPQPSTRRGKAEIHVKPQKCGHAKR